MTSRYGLKCKAALKRTALFMASSNVLQLLAAALFATQLHQETPGTVKPCLTTSPQNAFCNCFNKSHFKRCLNCSMSQQVCLMVTTLELVNIFNCNVEHPSVFYTCLFLFRLSGSWCLAQVVTGSGASLSQTQK